MYSQSKTLEMSDAIISKLIPIAVLLALGILEALGGIHRY